LFYQYKIGLGSFLRNKIDVMAQQEVFIKMVLDAWNVYVKRTDDLFNALSDEQLLNEIAPKRNRGIYLLGHLTAVHDRMLPILGFGNALYLNYTMFLLGALIGQ
jgi:hypothetical protein